MSEAPQLTDQDIDKLIVGADYHVFPGTTSTICRLMLVNGHGVVGESFCISQETFNAQSGRELAYKDARGKIWELEGYWLRKMITGVISVEVIAKVAHEVNKAFCESIGDHSQPSWDVASDWVRASSVGGVVFHIVNPDAGPEQSHENWMREKSADGWVYGEEKDPDIKTHPCMVPFCELPVEHQSKDHLFRQVVHSLLEISRVGK